MSDVAPRAVGVDAPSSAMPATATIPAATVPQMARAQAVDHALDHAVDHPLDPARFPVAAGKPATTVAHTTSPFAAATAPARHDSAAGSVGGAVLALVLVVGLILVLGWLARRMPGIGSASSNGLRVVGSLALGPRDRVMVVEVGKTQLLIGVGPGGMRTLHTLEEPLPVAAPASASPFAQLLAQHFGKKP
jgi:flagellar protein FliO/FliZ